MNYLKYFNNQISGIFSKSQNVYVYGQNIASGSHLSGLTRNLKLTSSSVLSNSPNSENSLNIPLRCFKALINNLSCNENFYKTTTHVYKSSKITKTAISSLLV